MDYLGQYGMGMLIDFATGLAMRTKDPTQEIFALDTNRKGHYLLDIVHHLTLGHHQDSGHAHVVVLQGQPGSETASDNQMLEFNPLQFDMTVRDQQFDDAEIACQERRLCDSSIFCLNGLDAFASPSSDNFSSVLYRSWRSARSPRPSTTTSNDSSDSRCRRRKLALWIRTALRESTLEIPATRRINGRATGCTCQIQRRAILTGNGFNAPTAIFGYAMCLARDLMQEQPRRRTLQWCNACWTSCSR